MTIAHPEYILLGMHDRAEKCASLAKNTTISTWLNLDPRECLSGSRGNPSASLRLQSNFVGSRSG
jgi:hypothetical protein